MVAIGNTRIHQIHVLAVPKYYVDAQTALTYGNVGSKRFMPVRWRAGHGVSPYEGTVEIDLRAVHNPHHDPKLRALTGLDAPVQEELAKYAEFHAVCQRGINMIEYHLDRVSSGRIQVLCICAGGRHRSVAAAEYITPVLRRMYPNARFAKFYPVLQEEADVGTTG